jgi:hypothetical protein
MVCFNDVDVFVETYTTYTMVFWKTLCVSMMSLLFSRLFQKRLRHRDFSSKSLDRTTKLPDPGLINPV